MKTTRSKSVMKQGAAIKKLRAHLGIKSQQAFANKLGVSVRTVAGWEAGRPPQSASRDALLKLAADEGLTDVSQAILAADVSDSIRNFVQTLFGTVRPNNPLTLQQRAGIGNRLHSIWIFAGKPKPTKADLAVIRRLADEAHQLLEDGMKIEEIPGDWKK